MSENSCLSFRKYFFLVSVLQLPLFDLDDFQPAEGEGGAIAHGPKKPYTEEVLALIFFQLQSFQVKGGKYFSLTLLSKSTFLLIKF